MAVYKVSEAAKNVGIDPEEMIKKLNGVGVSVSSSDDTISDNDLSLINDKSQQKTSLDKRQEMLKKAMERHKSGVKIKEVVLGKSTTSVAKSMISKEDLLRKKAELDKRIKMVDEGREQTKVNTANPAKITDNTDNQENVQLTDTATASKGNDVNTGNTDIVNNVEKASIPTTTETVTETVTTATTGTAPTGTAPTETATTGTATTGTAPTETATTGTAPTETATTGTATTGTATTETATTGTATTGTATTGTATTGTATTGTTPPATGVRAPTPRTKDFNTPLNSDGSRAFNNNGTARTYTNTTNSNSRTYTNSTGGRPPYNTSGTSNYNNNSTGSRPPYNTSGTSNYNNNSTGSRPPYNNNYNNNNTGSRPPYNNNSTSTGGGYNRDGRPDNRAGAGGSRPYSQDGTGGNSYNRYGSNNRPTDGNNPGFRSPSQQKGKIETPGLMSEEERRKVVKKKIEETQKDIDAKRIKAKKDAKKSKNWTNAIQEGIEELNIEKEVESGVAPTIDISDLASFDSDFKRQRTSGGRNNYRSRNDRRPRRKGPIQPNMFIRPTEISIGERIVLSDFSAMIGVKVTELIKKLFNMGTIASVNQAIDSETAQLLAIEYDINVNITILTEEDLLPVEIDEPNDLAKRPPIVTVMGHVDHGKTSLLDAIRSTSVVDSEAGGITQHIGAYEVESSSGKITFLDTPGHEAFTTLRARGALLTDIVILVVAADDGVKPQTKEAIDHAKAAGVRIVVAINKIDKEGANIDKVRQQLSEHGIISEEWGGEHQFQEISAKKRIGISELLERVLLEAEVLDLKGNPNRMADGVVIESRLDKQKGPVATVLIKNGTLRKGDTFISGTQFGKVRAMFNFKGVQLKEASVSVPCEIMGFSEVPQAGERFLSVDEKTAKQISELRNSQIKENLQSKTGKLTLAELFTKASTGELKDLNIILKADAQGSVEALSSSLLKLSNQEVRVNIIHDGIGGITESDISLAAASNAIVIGFNVRPDNNAKALADKEKVSIELYSVIYQAIDDIKAALEGLLNPDIKEVVSGKIEVRQLFSVPKIGKIAGSFVLEGKVSRNSLIRIVRDLIVVYEGKIGTLRRFTDDVKEVVSGYECGISLENYQDIRPGDVLEAYEMTEEKRTLADVEREELKAKNESKEQV